MSRKNGHVPLANRRLSSIGRKNDTVDVVVRLLTSQRTIRGGREGLAHKRNGHIRGLRGYRR
jgi:hypothetical protein